MPLTPFENFVLENKYNSILDTKIDMSAYLTVDRSLSENAGMTKMINTYTPTGAVQDLAKGVGNTNDSTVAYESKDYVVGVTQGRFPYYDEDAMSDPYLIESGLKGLAEEMINDFTKKAVLQWDETTQEVTCDFTSSAAGTFFNAVVDALAMFGEDQGEATLLVAPEHAAWIRKQLGNELKYVEDFVRTGYIGHVCGCPVVVTNALKPIPADPETGDLEQNRMFIVKKDAVTAFIKKETEVEQERDANTRQNTIYLRKVAVVALTDATKVVRIKKAN